MSVPEAAQKRLAMAKKLLDVEKELFDKEFTVGEAELANTPVDLYALEIASDVITLRQESLYTAFHDLLEVLMEVGDTGDLTFKNVKIDEAGYQTKLTRFICKTRRLLMTINNDRASSSGDTYRMKLPKRELPKFGGDVREWLGFWANFQEINSDQNIPTIEKFHYLMQCMEINSPAHKVVASYPVSSTNYKLTVDDLTSRFGRKKTLIKVYVRDLLKLVVDNAQGSKAEFVDLVTDLTSQLRNLEQLGVTNDKCADLLHPVIESCVPEDVLVAWQRSSNFEDNLAALMLFLQEEVNTKADRMLAHSQFKNIELAQKVNKSKQKDDTPTAAVFMTSGSDRKKSQCVFCDGEHPSQDCGKAASMSFEKRKEIVKDKFHCFSCLKKGHSVKKCNANYIKCALCLGKHFMLMCPTLGVKSGDGDVGKPVASPSMILDSSQLSVVSNNLVVKSKEVPLQTLVLKLQGGYGKSKLVRAMLDTGAQKSYIVESVARELQCTKIGEERVRNQLFGGTITQPVTQNIVKIQIAAPDGSNAIKLDVSCTPKISDHIIYPRHGSWVNEFMKQGVMFSDLNSKSLTIEVLLGNDVVPLLYTGRKHILEQGLIALETSLGWVLCGKIPAVDRSPQTSMMITQMQVTDFSLPELWALETIGIRDSAEVKKQEEFDRETQQHFEETVVRNDDGRYQVRLPWLSNMKSKLPSNFKIAKSRLVTTTRKLKEENLYEAYSLLFEQWENCHMIERVKLEMLDEGVHYLPHRAVVKNSSTTPVRPVFDASAKSGKGFASLNECLEKGPNKLEKIPKILTQLRLYAIGISSDISKAFQHIGISPDDRNYLCFLWWRDNSCTELLVYRHTRVPFGLTSSPFHLAATLEYHLAQSNNFPETAKELSDTIYVDNCITSKKTMDEAKRFETESRHLLLPAHFDLRGWEYGPSKTSKIVPVLGMMWETKYDVLKLDLAGALSQLKGEVTQRKMLSLSHMIFDPLGLACPFVLQAKLLLRECHSKKLGWDTPVPEDVKVGFETWRDQILLLEEVCVPRYVYFGDAVSITLHSFCDASSKAYAATLFLRAELDGVVKLNFLQGKTRVSPIKTPTIPRLELLPCLIASRLVATFVKEKEFVNTPIFYWSDSATALCWIKGDGPWQTFVANRVKEIRSLTNEEAWRHVPGLLNPADLPSRGCDAKKLINENFTKGPEWLLKSQESWPNSIGNADNEAVEKEMKRAVVVSLVSAEQFLQKFRKLSSFGKMCRVMCYVLRFALQLKITIKKCEILIFPKVPNARELLKAEKMIFLQVQQPLHSNPDHMKNLRPFLDEDGLFRTNTRILSGEEDFKTPIILPGGDDIVDALIVQYHVVFKHAGVSCLLSLLRERYWILNGRRTIRKVLSKCKTCKVHSARKVSVEEAPLPTARTLLSSPFSVVGVDAAGPLYLRDGKKMWIILYTCAVYRAVHLEMTDTMSTEGFLRTLRRFVARRGRPNIIYSDNGLNFVGANNAFKRVDWEKLSVEDGVSPIEWRFNPPAAPWWGGFFERMVGLVKQLLRRNLGKRCVDFDELMTMVIEVEDIVNSRPLTYITENSADPVPLTPNMFLRENSGCALPEADKSDETSFNNRLKHVQRLREGLKTRFRREYLGQILHSNKIRKSIQLKVGDVVIVEIDNKRRIYWPMGVIMEAIPGKDGRIRTYKVKTKDGVLVRAAQRLYILELQNEVVASESIPEIEDVKKCVNRYGRVIRPPVRY